MIGFASFPINTFDEECDNLILRDGNEILVKIIEITPDLIKYKRCKKEDGPLISVSKEDVFMIKYNDGTKELIKLSKKENKNVSNDNSSYIGYYTAYYILCGISIICSLLFSWVLGLLFLVIAMPFGIIGHANKKAAEKQ